MTHPSFGIWCVLLNVDLAWTCLSEYCCTGQCRNCRAPAVGRLCITCLSRRDCVQCSHRLYEGLFETAKTKICKACQRKIDKPNVRVNRSACGEYYRKLLWMWVQKTTVTWRSSSGIVLTTSGAFSDFPSSRTSEFLSVSQLMKIILIFSYLIRSRW